MARDHELIAEYEKAMGRPPANRFADDPDWTYRGTPKEREALRERVEEEVPEVIEGQESLFE